MRRQKEEIARLRQQLKSSSSSTTPPGKGTPAQRTSASRPRWETFSSQQEVILEHNEEEERDDEQKGESPDGGLDEGPLTLTLLLLDNTFCSITYSSGFP